MEPNQVHVVAAAVFCDSQQIIDALEPRFTGQIVRDVGDDGDVWLDPSCNHFSSTQSNLFLYCIYYIQAIRKIFFIFF